MKNAHGEYIYFLDGDDYIHVEAIEALVEAIKETDLELSVFDFIRTDSLQEDTHRPRERKPIEIVSREQMIFEMLSAARMKWCVVWNKLYKRTLLDGLFLKDAYSIQDQDFNIRVYQKIDQAAFIPEPLYWYVSNPNSLQRDSSYNAKRYYYNTKYRFEMLENILPGKNEKKYRAWILYYGYFQMSQRREIEKGTEFEDDFRKLSKDIIKNTGREFFFMRDFSFRKKMRFFVSWYFPRLYEAMTK